LRAPARFAAEQLLIAGWKSELKIWDRDLRGGFEEEGILTKSDMRRIEQELVAEAQTSKPKGEGSDNCYYRSYRMITNFRRMGRNGRSIARFAIIKECESGQQRLLCECVCG
jgi:hypothetical protein